MIGGTQEIPLLSVIVPVYNTEKYLSRCLNSILSQTYDNLEIICVDDGSTDRSGEILDYYAANDQRVIVVHSSNRGVSEARNRALELAEGAYIGFVDSDDYIDPDMYKMLLGGFEDDVDIVACSYYFAFDDKLVWYKNQEEILCSAIDTKKFMEYIYRRDKYKGVAGYIVTRLFRRELIYKQNIKFDNLLSEGEDVYFMAKVLLKCKKIKYFDQPLYYYYQRDNSSVHNLERQVETLSWCSAYERVIELYEENEISQNILNLVIRMYVYRCGKLLETAIKMRNVEKKEILKNNIKKYLSIYRETNVEYADRIDWLENLLQR